MANATLIVTCSGGTHFDRDHYVDVHLPLARTCWQRHGPESAAAFFPRDGLLVFGDPLTLDADEVDRMIDVNLCGTYFGSIEAARLMPNGGRILVIGSDTADSMPFTGLSAYVMTKAAVQGMARGLSRYMGAHDITVNVIQPGPTDTEMNPATGPRAAEMLEPMSIKRYGTADEVASLTLYLAGPQARGTTGAFHTIGGGC